MTTNNFQPYDFRGYLLLLVALFLIILTLTILFP